MIKELRKRPFARLLFLWITGTLLQYYLPNAFRCSYLLLLPVMAGMGGYCFPSVRGRYSNRWWWGGGFACLVLFLSIQLTHYSEQDSAWTFGTTDSFTAKAIVTDTPREKPRSYYCPLQLTILYSADTVISVNKYIQAYFEKDSAAVRLQPGDELIIRGRFRPVELPYLRNKGFAASIYLPAAHWKQIPDTGQCSFVLQTLRWRDLLVARYARLRLSDEERAALSAITFGYTGEMSNRLRQSFSLSGVSHILSVSGFHVAIVCAFITLLFSFLPKSSGMRLLTYLLTLLFLWLFTALTGLSSSAVRAALMLSFYLTGRLLHRTTDGYNTMASSAFLMLVYNPFYLFDVGFQLSYIAVLFILYLQPRLTTIWKIRNPLLASPWGCVTVTLAAQLGTTPLCLYTFGMVSTVFLFTNLPLSLLATLLIPSALGWVILSPWLPNGCFLQLAPEVLTRWMVWLVNRFSALPGASFSVPFGFPEMLLCYAVLFFFLLYQREKRPRVFLFSLFLVLIILLILLARMNKLFGN